MGDRLGKVRDVRQLEICSRLKVRDVRQVR